MSDSRGQDNGINQPMCVKFTLTTILLITGEHLVSRMLCNVSGSNICEGAPPFDINIPCLHCQWPSTYCWMF